MAKHGPAIKAVPMPTLLAETALTVTDSRSPLGFSTTGGGHWPEWDRFLTVDGEPSYLLGNVCGTCGFLFERLDGGGIGLIQPWELAARLAEGLDSLPADVVETLAPLMPAGDYRVLLLRLRPRLAMPGGADDYFATEQVENEGGIDPFWGLPHYPQVAYYRADRAPDVPLPSARPEPGRGFDFVVPMLPETALDRDRTGRYEAAIAGGSRPTAVALSVLDVKGPAQRGVEHWCMAHYLVDGHHKMAAAARAGAEVGLIAFVATARGVSSPEAVETFVRSYG